MNHLSYIWEWFLEIFLWGGYGMAPFKTPFAEIEAYSRIMRVQIEPWEARVIRDLGGAYLRHEKKRTEKGKLQNVTSMSDSEGLKALFAGVGQRKPTMKDRPDGPRRTGPGN